MIYDSFLKIFDIGKYHVCIFAIVLGIFASKVKEEKIGNWILKRYIYFFISGAFINTIYFGLGSLTDIFGSINVGDLIVQSLIIGGKIFPPYWCMQAFFLGSILVQINSRGKADLITVIFEMVFLTVTGQLFVAACLCGYLITLLGDSKAYQTITNSIIFRVGILFAAWGANYLLSAYDESLWLYITNVITACFTVIAFSPRNESNRLLDAFARIPFLKNYMSMYIIHMVVLTLAGRFFFEHGLGFGKSMILTLITIMLLSIPVQKIIDYICGKLYGMFLTLETKASK